MWASKPNLKRLLLAKTLVCETISNSLSPPCIYSCLPPLRSYSYTLHLSKTQTSGGAWQTTLGQFYDESTIVVCMHMHTQDLQKIDTILGNQINNRIKAHKKLGITALSDSLGIY